MDGLCAVAHRLKRFTVRHYMQRAPESINTPVALLWAVLSMLPPNVMGS
jgi:hypothetical protein